jgi:hypothetical protein
MNASHLSTIYSRRTSPTFQSDMSIMSSYCERPSGTLLNALSQKTSRSMGPLCLLGHPAAAEMYTHGERYAMVFG